MTSKHDAPIPFAVGTRPVRGAARVRVRVRVTLDVPVGRSWWDGKNTVEQVTKQAHKDVDAILRKVARDGVRVVDVETITLHVGEE